MNTFIGVDIGGTNTKLGILRDGLHLEEQTSFPTLSEFDSKNRKPNRYLDLLAAKISQAVARNGAAMNSVSAVGIGVPGQVDHRTGIVYDATNLGWTEVRLAQEMSDRLQLPVWVDHDVRTIARGELYAGAGQGKKDIVCVALGTGIAAAVIVDGRVVQGTDYCAGEIGHDAVRGWTDVCNCGKIGCLETIVSASGIARLAEEAIRQGASSILTAAKLPITAYDVHQACIAGDAEAIRIFRFAAETLGEKLATVVALLNPEMIIIGGGLSQAEGFLLEPLRSYLYAQFPSYKKYLQIVGSPLGDRAGVLGAAHHAAQRMGVYE
jgi:glucokinase